MNLAIQKLTEINEALTDLKKGKIVPELYDRIISGSMAAYKWASLVVQAYAVESKNRRTLKGLEKMNILDEFTAVEMGLRRW